MTSVCKNGGEEAVWLARLCTHMGVADVLTHLSKDIHLKNVKAARSQTSLNFVSTPLPSLMGYVVDI